MIYLIDIINLCFNYKHIWKLNYNDIEKDIIESINKITSNDLNNYYKNVCKTINDHVS